NRIAHRDWRAAAAAAAAKQYVAQNGNVVVPAERVAALRTTRAGADHRLAPRQTVYADVQEAANTEAEQCEPRENGSVSHLGGRIWRCSAGMCWSDESGATDTSP